MDAKAKEKEQEEALKKRKEQIDALDEYENQKIKIDVYYRNLKYYSDIDPYSTYKYNIKENYNSDLKSECGNKLKKWYYDKETQKKKHITNSNKQQQT